MDVVDPPVQVQRLTPPPGILDGGGVRHVHHLLLDVELAQAPQQRGLVLRPAAGAGGAGRRPARDAASCRSARGAGLRPPPRCRRSRSDRRRSRAPPCRISTAYCRTDRQLMSVWMTRLATLRWTKISPGSSPTISFAGTRLSAQPIHRYLGVCWRARSLKKPRVYRGHALGPAAVVVEQLSRGLRALPLRTPTLSGVGYDARALFDVV